MSKSINKIIPLAIYPFDIMVSIAQTDKQFSNSLKPYNVSDEDIIFTLDEETTKRGRTIRLETGQVIMRINFYPRGAFDYGCLQHEIFHAIEFTLDKIGMPLTFDSDEAYAYLIQFITTEIYKLLKFK